MNFKFTLILIVVALLVLDADAWGRRRRRRRHSRRRRRRSSRRTIGHVAKWAGHVAKWALKFIKWDVEELKDLRKGNQAEYDKAMDEIRQIVSDQEGDEAAKFVTDTFDYVTSENPEPVSDEKKTQMDEFMDAFSQNIESDEFDGEFIDEDFM